MNASDFPLLIRPSSKRHFSLEFSFPYKTDYRSGDANSQPAVELTALLVVGHRSLLGGFLETSGPMANCIWLRPSAGAVV
jgi:hypothetical protein